MSAPNQASSGVVQIVLSTVPELWGMPGPVVSARPGSWRAEGMMMFSKGISWRRAILYAIVAVLLLLLLLAFAPQASAETQLSSAGFYYAVQWGDTLSALAVRYGTTVYAISQANGIVNPNLIYAGQVLWIPTAYVTPTPPVAQCRAYHTVNWGETMYRIGLWYGVSPWAIAQANNIYNLNLIYAGQTLCIP